MPSALPETSLVNDHGGSPNDTEIPIANGEPAKPSKGDKPEGKDKDEKKSIPRIRASKLEYKTVNQIWDRKSYGHKLVEQLDKTDDEDVYEEYIFVERRKYDEYNRNYKTFIDVKSELLRDTLRQVLKDIRTISLHSDSPEIRAEILYHHLPQLEARLQSTLSSTDKEVRHLELLVRFLQTHFASAIKTLPKLLEHDEITFDLLWALFPPNSIVYSVDESSEQPECTIVDFGEDREGMRGKFFALDVRNINWDGKVFGEVSDIIVIFEFPGAQPITSLDAFPLKYHQDMSTVKSTLIKRGRRFTALAGVHHCTYSGLAHVKKDPPAKTVKFSAKGRLMVDSLTFREHNPNYNSPRVIGSVGRAIGGIRARMNDLGGDLVDNTSNPIPAEPRSYIISDPAKMKDNDLLICSPTVLGFSLEKRVWAEFAVSGIEEITWATLPFNSLVIPEKKKDILQALVQETTGNDAETAFDDVVEGKGQGLIILLHGPPGVGKTLTAEAISEHRHRPLYRATAGDLGLDADGLEFSLTQMLDLVARWRAILLLDEADVFLESRERQHLQHNTLVSVFLRQLEYFQGVMILTTNRVTAFDDAVQSRVHLGIKYEALGRRAKGEIWTTFLKQATGPTKDSNETNITSKQLEELCRRDFNGRQIKNTVRMAHSLAIAKKTPLGHEHLLEAMEANEEFDDDFRGGSGNDARKAYL